MTKAVASQPTGGNFVFSIEHSGIEARSEPIPHSADSSTVNAARRQVIERWETLAGRALPASSVAHVPIVIEPFTVRPGAERLRGTDDGQ